MSSPRHVFYISDRTGLTAENIGEALLNQFGNLSFKRHTHPFVDTPEKARAVVEKVNRVSRKTVSVRLRLSVWLMTKSVGLSKGRMLFRLISLRLFGTVGEELNTEATASEQGHHSIGNTKRYDARMEAVNFSLNHDDGVSDKNASGSGCNLDGCIAFGQNADLPLPRPAIRHPCGKLSADS